ncbi:MAG: NADH-quinone oxidoreductase subunit NuoH [Candidatus Zipacnadales bacterium]
MTQGILTWIRDIVSSAVPIPDRLLTILGWAVGCLVIVGAVLFTVIYLIYVERKISAWIQSRIGPNRVGPWGLLQTVMDALKLMLKEDIMPAASDKLLFTVAPVLVFSTALITLVVIPWDSDVSGGEISIGILFISAVASMTVIGIMTAGWASNNKWSLLGGLRSAAQMVSYEVPQALALISVVMWTNTLSLREIGAAQGQWFWEWNILKYWLWLPALIYFTASIAEVNRTPFDLPEAESELVAGFNTEYTGMKFACFFVGEFASMFVVSLVFATLFLGGWKTGIGPLDKYVPGPLVIYGKAWLVVLVMMWIRWTLPRLRVDQLMGFCWKLLIPAGLIAIVTVGVVVGVSETMGIGLTY